MASRREVLSYISAGTMFGGIVGYYVGAQELLGIQSEHEVRTPDSENPTGTPTDRQTETPTDRPTETQTPNQPGGERISIPFEETFTGGLNGWTVNQRYRLPEHGPNPGNGGHSEKYGGSARLHVDGGPSTIGVARKTTGIKAGTTITADLQIETSGPQPGNISIAVYAPDGDDVQEERFKNEGEVTRGELELAGTVENEYPEGAEIRVFADVWPGEFTAYVTSIQAETDNPGDGQSGDFVDQFERSEMPNLTVVEGEENYWTITDGIEGRSLQGEGGASKGDGGRIRYVPDKYSWSGDRRISVRFNTDTDYSKRHAQLYFWDDGNWWQVAASLPLRKFRLRHENQDQIQGLPKNVETSMDATETHELTATIRGDTVTASFDGEDLIEYTHSEQIGGGSVGFGIGFERATVYDDLRVILL